MKDIWGNVVAIGAAVIGLAILAVIVSKQADTSSVLDSAFGGLSSVIKAAVSPISGGGMSLPNLPKFGG